MTKCKCKARRCCKMCFSCLNQLRNLTVEGCQYRSVHQDLLRDLLRLSTSTYSQYQRPPHTHTHTHTHSHTHYAKIRDLHTHTHTHYAKIRDLHTHTHTHYAK